MHAKTPRVSICPITTQFSNRKSRYMLHTAAAIMMALGMSACGGGGAVTPVTAVTPTPANTVFVDMNNANASGTSCGSASTPCKTITAGILAATNGQTVLVSSGTYVEQVSITKSITLTSVTPYGAVIQAPGTLTPDTDGLVNIVRVGGDATTVATAVISGLTVKGPGPSGCGSLDNGIFVANANATITGNKILSIRDTAYSGCQNGAGISINYKMGTKYVGHTDTISNNIVLDYQKVGIVVDGANTVTVTNNTVTGQNKPGVNGQNGIEILRGATGTVDSNTVSGNIYGASLSDTLSDGIMLYHAVGVTVTKNTVSGNDEGVGVYSNVAYSDSSSNTNPVQVVSNMTIKNNKVTNNGYLGIHIDPFSSGNTILNNTVTGNNGGWDDLEEHPTYTFNNWGTDPSQYDTVGLSGRKLGLVFSY